MIVVDASTAVLALLDDGDARALLTAESLAAPHLIDSEVVQTFRSLVRRGEVRHDHAQAALERWARLGMQRVGVAGLVQRMWQLRENVSAYDASYVAVAETLGCSLVTADERLSRAPGIGCPVSIVAT